MPVLDMKPYIEHKKKQLGNRVSLFETYNNMYVSLGIITNDKDNKCQSYLKSKGSIGMEVGITTNIQRVNSTSSLKRVIKSNKFVGLPMILQEPLDDPDMKTLYGNMTRDFDVDGFFGFQDLVEGNYSNIPATAKGIHGYLTEEKGLNLNLRGKNVVIYGRGKLVGYPLAMMMINEGATVTVLNSQSDTTLASVVTEDADVIILATGKRGSLSLSDFTSYKEDRYIINVGTVFDNFGKLTTELFIDKEVDVNEIGNIHWTDRINAVGPCTVLALLDNVVNWYERRVNTL